MEDNNSNGPSPSSGRGRGLGLNSGSGRDRSGRGRGRGRGRNNYRGGGGGSRATGTYQNPSSSTGTYPYHAAYPQCDPNGTQSSTHPLTNPTNNKNSTDDFVYDTNEKSHMPVCTFYLAGRCNATGPKCRFHHPHPDALDNIIFTEQRGKHFLHSTTVHRGGPKKSNQNVYSSSKRKNNGSVREFDPFKAEAINIAKTAQDMEIHNLGSMKGPFYSMDIECVACGYGHTNLQRYPCRVSLVKDVSIGISDNTNNNNENNSSDSELKEENDNIEIVMDEIVNLSQINVASYMTPLTGMTAEQCLDPNNTKTLDEIRELVKAHLPKDCILVGHSIQHDIDWLGLEVGNDFKLCIDTSCLFRQRIPKNLGSASNALRFQVNASINNDDSFKNDSEHGSGTTRTTPNHTTTPSNDDSHNRSIAKSSTVDHYDQPDDTNIPFPTKYRLFSLRHCCIHLLNTDIQENAHNPILDAKYSLLLFRKYQFATPQYLRALRDALHRAPPTPSFAAENPIIDGVVLSFAGYRFKWAGRFIWKWWVEKRRK